MRSTRLALATIIAFAVLVPCAQAFDTGPHADMTRDALTAEGFGRAGADLGMVENWLVDYYTNPDDNPYSGHAGFWLGLARLGLQKERWDSRAVYAARHMHFDANRHAPSHPDLSQTEGIEREWQRLMFLTRKWTQYEGRRNDPLGVMAVLGTSLHAIQDFYAHSNWVEAYAAEFGRWGPGLTGRGLGEYPTWFDVPPAIRETLHTYVGVAGIPRGHGHWASDDNYSNFNGLNKDWPGRPWYDKAYVSAYFASRQWIHAVRTWLGNEPLWKRMQNMAGTSALAHDVEGAEKISIHSGHWQGGGEPCLPFKCGDRTGKAGSIASLRLALGDYHDRSPTPYRKAFERTILAWGEYPPELPGLSLPDLPSTRSIQGTTKFVRLDVLDYRGLGLGDPVGQSDNYVNARIAGQSYTSTVINGSDAFAFPRPYAPSTWIRSLPTTHRSSVPVTSITVRVETGDRRFAGTDDDVYLRINGRQRFPLEKRLFNDFERGDDDTYAVPLDTATRAGLTVGDLDRVSIEKGRDGAGGGWYLHGVTVRVNDQVVASDRRIDRWLEDDRRTWTARGVTRDHRVLDVVGIRLEILDDDFGNNDLGDLHPDDRNTSFRVAYVPGTDVRQTATGGDRHKGRLALDNGDRARLTFRLSTIVVDQLPLSPGTLPPSPPGQPLPVAPADPLPPPTPPPPLGTPLPDLAITEFLLDRVTVRNNGPGPSGTFNVLVQGSLTVRSNGTLAAGASTTLSFAPISCFLSSYVARADSSSEVAETDETNNLRTGLTQTPIC